MVLDSVTNTKIYHNNFVNNPLQALAQNGIGNTFYQDTPQATTGIQQILEYMETKD